MKTLFTSLFIGIASIISSSSVLGRDIMPNNSKPENTQLKESAAGCLPAANYAELNINNVRARINSGGDMWWDLNGLSKYEIPKGSGRTSMFAGALWIGGVDVNSNLKLAAQRYRGNGNDFWTGPLSVDGTASIDASTCNAYDKIFTTYREDIVNFLAYHSNPALYPQYQIPDYFFTYPAHGDQSLGQSFYLAPFYDNNEDGVYNPQDGDYPYYDVNNRLCQSNLQTAESEMGITSYGLLSDQILKGDQNLWWVFNDKGNVHTETQGNSIGLEIRAQAFAFAGSDEINNATFYSYEIINRSASTLYETYLGMFVDPDVGGSKDDLIGCDVLRGLGYAYNGDDFDEDSDGAYGYGDRPAAIGVDFFQGPYIDPDGIDNPPFSMETDIYGVTTIYNCNAALNGVNFGNGIIDDERYGLNYFLRFSGTGTVQPYMTDPSYSFDYYNFLHGVWADNTHMIYGGNGHLISGGYGPDCNFMFPGMSDPCNYGTGGIAPNGPKNWTEETAGNMPYDRRFMQSAGPFTMEPGEVNYLTVGVPWARSQSGSASQAIDLLKVADDKCQALFNSCFRLLDGPDAPDVTLQELDREVILYLSNSMWSNNYKEEFFEIDPSIVSPDSMHYDSLYRFEGYQIFQVVDQNVKASDIYDASKARLVAQCDIKNGIDRIINYVYSEDLGLLVPREEVDGDDAGITHSFRITEDRFAASGNQKLINNKKYYYLVVAYAFNEYEKFSQDPDFQFPGEISAQGQKKPYLPGRRNVKVYTAIPHNPAPEANGTLADAQYGDHPKITRIEGQGNGGFVLELNNGEREQIFNNNFKPELTYKNGYGPVDVKVIDPLNVKNAQYILRLDSTNSFIDSCFWVLEEYDLSWNLLSTYNSDKSIALPFEQVFLDLGISICFSQAKGPGDPLHPTNGFLEATVEYSNPGHPWLSGVPDVDGPTAYNWIRSGVVVASDAPEYNDYMDIDDNEYYEKILGGTWAPYRLVSNLENNPGSLFIAGFQSLNKMQNLASVDIVFTPDKSKWSRCPVIETCDDALLSEGGATKYGLRKHASVDKDGNSGTTEANYDGKAQGMGWFPGYAVNVETGERLNIIFGENSWMESQKGNDMVLNPNSEFESLSQILFGGEHYIYVFEHNVGDSSVVVPQYDEGDWLYKRLLIGGTVNLRTIFSHAMWTSIPMLAPGETWLSNECRVRIRVSKPYAKNYSTYGSSSPLNNNFPMYRFNTSDLTTIYNDNATARTALDLINVVPNPYYASGGYEDNVFENKIKITNVPSTCTVSIYTIDGVMIRQFKNSDRNNTTIEWDLTNFVGKRISGGLYLIHVSAPGIGERTIKWFGSLRTVTMNSF